MEDEKVVDLKTSETIFAENDIELKKLFEQFNVQVEVCILVILKRTSHFKDL